MTTLTTREVFQAGTDAFNAHDIDAFAELLADDVVFDAPGMPRDSGRAASLPSTEAGSRPSPTPASRSTPSMRRATA